MLLCDRLRSIHHAQAAQVTVREAKEHDAEDEQPFVCEEMRVNVRLVVGEQEERNEQYAQEDRQPETLRRWRLDVVRQNVADHREEIEVKETADRTEKFAAEKEALVVCLDFGDNGRKQQQRDEESEKDVETLNAAVLQDVHVGRPHSLGCGLIFGRVESVEVLREREN